jgi:hypothetical protein
MPHPAKKSKTTKQQKRASRVMLRKKKQNEFEHLQYLKSQLDENGVPLDLLNTNEELLNNEQKFITRLVRRLSQIDTRSLIIPNKNKSYYKKVISKKITEYYNLNKKNKSWIKQFFKDTYNCLGFSNLYEYLTYELPIENIEILETIEMPDKPVLTKELSDNIIRECSKDFDFYKLDISELLNTILLLDIQNRDYCNITQQFGGWLPPYIVLPTLKEFVVNWVAPLITNTAVNGIVKGYIFDPLMKKVGNLYENYEVLAAKCEGLKTALEKAKERLTDCVIKMKTNSDSGWSAAKNALETFVECKGHGDAANYLASEANTVCAAAKESADHRASHAAWRAAKTAASDAACVGAGCAVASEAACVGAGCSVASEAACVGVGCTVAKMAAAKTAACVGAACALAKTAACTAGTTCLATKVIPACVGAACATGLI